MENVTVIGGGTGLSTMLKGLRLRTSQVTAIVTVADDGGSSGILRSDYNMLPPGDVRNCVSALTGLTKDFREILDYRFKKGVFKGHSIGNIILAAINENTDTFEEAVEKYCRFAGVSGRVVPVTNEDVVLHAVLQSGKTVDGESRIGEYRGDDGIDRVFLTPSSAKATSAAIEGIMNADVIVMGPGSLYTSVIPNLLVDGVTEAIKQSSAVKIYVCNLMTQPGETDGYDVQDHLYAVEKHSYKGIADVVIANDTPIPETLLEKYRQEHSSPVLINEKKSMGKTKLIVGDFYIMRNGQTRHNFSRLATAIVRAAHMWRK